MHQRLTSLHLVRLQVLPFGPGEDCIFVANGVWLLWVHWASAIKHFGWEVLGLWVPAMEVCVWVGSCELLV